MTFSGGILTPLHIRSVSLGEIRIPLTSDSLFTKWISSKQTLSLYSLCVGGVLGALGSITPV